MWHCVIQFVYENVMSTHANLLTRTYFRSPDHSFIRTRGKSMKNQIILELVERV